MHGDALHAFIDTLNCQEPPGAGGIRALRCLTQRRTGVNIFIIRTAHRFLREDAWERKSLHATMYIGRPFNREIPYFLTLCDGGFPSFSTPAEQTGGNRDPVKETAKKSLNDRSRI